MTDEERKEKKRKSKRKWKSKNLEKCREYARKRRIENPEMIRKNQ